MSDQINQKGPEGGQWTRTPIFLNLTKAYKLKVLWGLVGPLPIKKVDMLS